MLIKSTVKTRTKTEKVEILKAEEFFKMLFDIGVITSNKINENICNFLCIDTSYLNTLMFKKLKRAVYDF